MHYNIAQSLAQSRKSVVSGAFLTRAQVIKGSLRPLGTVSFQFGVHEFPDTVVAAATIIVHIPQPVPAAAPAVPQSEANTAAVRTGTLTPKPIQQTVHVQELLFGFKENPGAYFLVPRDSTIKELTSLTFLFTFLTLRKQPGSTNLHHQVIPVTLEINKDNKIAVENISKHINADAEVKEKMANAMRVIPKMELERLTFAEPAASKDISSSAPPATENQSKQEAGEPEVQQQKRKKRIPSESATPAQTKRRKSMIKSEETTDKKQKKKPKQARSSPTAGAGISEGAAKIRKQKKASIIPDGWSCEICGVTTTVMRRRGPSGLNCACKEQMPCAVISTC